MTVPLCGMNGCGNNSRRMSYTLGVPIDAYRHLASRGEKLCTQVHPSRGGIHPKHILSRSYVPQVHPSENYVPQVHPSEELCIPNTSFREAMYSEGILHHLTCVAYKHAVHMKCHHENFNHRFSNLFHAYKIFQISNDQNN